MPIASNCFLTRLQQQADRYAKMPMRRASSLLFTLLLCVRVCAQPGKLNTLKLQLTNAKSDSQKVRLRYEIGIACPVLRTSYWDSLLTDARACHLRSIEGRALQGLGRLYLVNNFHARALNNFMQSYRIALETGDTAAVFAPLTSISRLFYIKNEIRRALDYCYRGMELAEFRHDTLNMANCLFEESLCYFSNKDLNRAIALQLRCLKLYSQLGNNRGIAESLLSLGADYYGLHQYNLMQGYYLECKKYTDLFGDDFISVDVNNALASAYNNLNQWDSCYKYACKSYQIARRCKSNLYTVRAMGELATALYAKGERAKGRMMGETALKIAKTTGFTLQLANFSGILKKFYLSEHNYKKALEMEELYTAATAKLVNQQALEKEFDHHLELKENENQLLTLELRQNRYILAGLAIVAVLILVITYLFFRQQKLRNEQESTLLEQKLLRTQMNPHFIFNSLQAVQSFIVGHDVKEALRYLSSFAKVIRHVLENSRADSIALDQEIDLLKNYLYLQQLRFGQRFSYSIHIDEAINGSRLLIPPMLLQPFIENAVEHGMYDIQSGGILRISYRLDKQFLYIEIVDNGYGMSYKPLEAKKHRSLALEITRERIALMNKRGKIHASFTISDAFPNEKDHKGVKVSFRFPLDH